MASFGLLCRGLGSSGLDAKELREGQPFAPAARPGIIFSRRQAAEKWPACAPAARPGLGVS